jgi:hypothetical protein
MPGEVMKTITMATKTIAAYFLFEALTSARWEALEDNAFLLTIAWPEDASKV